MQPSDKIQPELDLIRAQLVTLASETLALNWLLSSLLIRVCTSFPSVVPEIREAFSDIGALGNDAEIVVGSSGASAAKALRILDEIQQMLFDHPKTEIEELTASGVPPSAHDQELDRRQEGSEG